ncbi:MAG: exo-alpha-sialidase [Anaerolineae bacterium]|nr:exo-alpha-sialidase [Anaerolineae bacterium]
MSKRYWKALSGILLALGMVSLVLLITHAAGGDPEWSTDAFADFCQGTMNGVDVWSVPGAARLDHRWFLNIKVNDDSSQSKLSPRLSFALTNTGTTTETVFLAVWADERSYDHHPDIYFARSINGGRTWLSDTLIADTCASSGCPSLNTPDIIVRATDGNFWVVWHEASSDNIGGGDPGDIKYATSDDKGDSWSSVGLVHSGKARLPRIAPHGASGNLYTLWEDERDDGGDIYISRYTSSWSTPIKTSDAISGTQQREPHLAVSYDGNVYAVWEDTRENDDGEVYFSRWLSGTTWSASNWMTNTRLSDPTMCGTSVPDIIAGPMGVLYATWVEQVSTGPSCTTSDSQIVVARSNDQGDTWNHTIVKRLYDAYGGGAISSYDYLSIGVDRSGKVYVAWIHLPDQTAYSDGTTLFSSSPDRGLHWTTPRSLSSQQEVCGDAPLSLISDFEGEVVVAWEDYRESSGRQIYATGYPADRYLTSGEYRRDLDAGGPAAWGTITWTATITPNTGLQIATRVMTTAGAGWTDWFTYTASGDAIPHPSGRLIQYRAVFTSTALPGNDTSVLDEVVISYEQYRVFLPLVLREG